MWKLAAVIILLSALAAVVPQSGGDDRAHAALDRAIAALGGREALTRLDRWVVSGRGRENLSAEWQGRAVDSPTWRDHEETVVVIGGSVAWERRTPRNDMSLRWRRFIHRPDMSGFVDWHAKRSRLAPPGTPDTERQALARRIPHVLLRQIAAGNRGVRWLAESRLDGNTHDMIQIELADSLSVRLHIARPTGTLGRLEYDAFLPSLGDRTVRWSWTDWSVDANLGRRPGRQTIAVDDSPYQEIAFTRYEANASDAAAFVELPATLQPEVMMGESGPTAAGPAAGEIAPGVHVRSIQGFNVMTIVGAEALTVIEAPEFARGLEAIPASNAARSGRVAMEHARWLVDAFPGKAIRHMVISHHHGDHSGGLPILAGRGVTVLSSAADAGALRHVLAAPRRLAPWPEPAAAAKFATVEAVSGRRAIDDGVRRIEIMNTGDNPHSLDNLLVWLPAERILFQGDLFYFDEGAAFPPRGREIMNRFFAGWLAARGIQPRLIYGVHNTGAAGPDALARMK